MWALRVGWGGGGPGLVGRGDRLVGGWVGGFKSTNDQPPCEASDFKEFFELWRENVRCWLCDNQNFVNQAHKLIRKLMTADMGITRDRLITKPWLDSCLPGYLLAMFATTRSTTIQTWRFSTSEGTYKNKNKNKHNTKLMKQVFPHK